MYRWLAALIVAFAVFATLLWGSKWGGSGGHAPAARARTEERFGIVVVRLSGAPRAKGRALGEALRDRIQGELERALPDDPGLRDFAVKTCGERLTPFLPEACREEIAGIAEGARIAFDEALFLDTRFEIAAFGLAEGAGDLPAEAAAGPGPEAACLLPAEAALDLVVVVHEDLDPPLVLVGRPGMAGAFLGISDGAAAAMRPMREETPPPLKGLVWTLLFRRILETAPSDPPRECTGPLSVAMSFPDGTAGTLNLAVSGAAWRGGDVRAPATDEPVAPCGVGPVPRLERDAGDRARTAEEAARILGGPLPKGMIRVSLRGGGATTLVVEGPEGRRTLSLGDE